MLRKTMIIFPAALVAAMPFAAMAETMSQSKLKMFNGATPSLQQADDAALAAQQGKLAECRSTMNRTVVLRGRRWCSLPMASHGP